MGDGPKTLEKNCTYCMNRGQHMIWTKKKTNITRISWRGNGTLGIMVCYSLFSHILNKKKSRFLSRINSRLGISGTFDFY